MNPLERLKEQASRSIKEGRLSHEEIMNNLKPFLEKSFKSFFTQQEFTYSSSYSKYDGITTYKAEYGDISIELTINDNNLIMLFRFSKDLKSKEPRGYGLINQFGLKPCNFDKITLNQPDNYLFITDIFKKNKLYKRMSDEGIKIEELFIAICDDPEKFIG